MEAHMKPKILLFEPDYATAKKREAFLKERNFAVTCIGSIDQLAFDNGQFIPYDANGAPLEVKLSEYVIALFDGNLSTHQPPPIWAIIPWLIHLGITCLAVGSTEEQTLLLSVASFSIRRSDFELFVEVDLPTAYADALGIREN
jgi:hypothetical protein